MKQIKLKPFPPFHNSVDVAVIDFPQGLEGRERQRCKVTAEFAQVDVKQLQKQGMDFEQAMEYYRQWLYQVVKHHIGQEWECTEGWEEVMDIISEKVQRYY